MKKGKEKEKEKEKKKEKEIGNEESSENYSSEEEIGNREEDLKETIDNESREENNNSFITKINYNSTQITGAKKFPRNLETIGLVTLD